MNILFICDFYPQYGAKVVKELVHKLLQKRKGIIEDIYILSNSAGIYNNKFHTKREKNVVRVSSFSILPKVNYTISPFSIYKIKKLIQKLKPSLVHIHFLIYWNSLVGAFMSKVAHISSIITLHGFTHPSETNSAYYSFLLALYYKIFGNKILKNADAVTAVSLNTLDKVTSYFPEIPLHKFNYIPNGVDTEKFQSLKDDSEKIELRRKLGLPVDHFLVIYVGRLEVEKGVLDLLKVANLMDKEHSDIKFLFIGNGSLKRYIKDYQKNHKNVIYFDYRDPYPYLAASDVFVLPSFREGFSTSFLEAVSSGLPFISTYVGGVDDFLRRGGEGIIVSRGDINSIMKSILLLRDNYKEWKKVAIGNRRIVEKYFSLDVVAEMYKELYTRICE